MYGLLVQLHFINSNYEINFYCEFINFSYRTEHDGTASMPDMWRSQSGLEERMRPGSADLLLEPSMNGLDISGGADDPRFGNQDHVTIPIVKGGMGFGFTIADSVFGQKVKKILDRPRCKNLNEGDILVEINNINVQNMNHTNVVQVLKDCPRGQEAAITIQRGNSLNLTKNKFKKKEENGGMKPKSGFLFRSKTPTAELFATQEKEIVPMRPKTPIVDTRNMAQKNWNGELNQNLSPFSRNDFSRASLGVGGRTEQHGSFDMLSEQLSMVGLKGHPAPRSHSPGRELDQPQYQYNYNYQHQNGFLPNGYDSGYGYSGYNGDYPAAPQVQGYSPNGNGYRAGSLPRGRKDSSSFEQSDQLSNNMRWGGRRDGELEMVVVLLRHDSGFGFRIVGGTEEGSQVKKIHLLTSVLIFMLNLIERDVRIKLPFLKIYFHLKCFLYLIIFFRIRVSFLIVCLTLRVVNCKALFVLLPFFHYLFICFSKF